MIGKTLLVFHGHSSLIRAAAYNMLKKLESEAAKLEEQDAGEDFEGNSAVESSYLAILKVSEISSYKLCSYQAYT